MQKKHIQLHTCRSRATAVKNSNEMSELLLNCTNASFKYILAITGIAGSSWSGHRCARITQMSQFRCCCHQGVRRAAGGTWEVLLCADDAWQIGGYSGGSAFWWEPKFIYMCLWHDRSLIWASPMPGQRYVEEISSGAMLATKRSAGVTPGVNLGECVTCMS